MSLPLAPTLADAQRDMRQAHFGGAPGMVVSAMAWCVAGLVALRVSPERAVWTLLLGGMFIHPLAVLIAKALGRSGNHARGNPLGALALATTAWLVLSLPLAYGVSMLRIEWFFPAMMLVIGGRYLTFAVLFGTRLYWACGAALALAGYLLGRAGAATETGAFAGAAIEAVFAVALLVVARRDSPAIAAPACPGPEPSE